VQRAVDVTPVVLQVVANGVDLVGLGYVELKNFGFGRKFPRSAGGEAETSPRPGEDDVGAFLLGELGYAEGK